MMERETLGVGTFCVGADSLRLAYDRFASSEVVLVLGAYRIPFVVFGHERYT